MQKLDKTDIKKVIVSAEGFAENYRQNYRQFATNKPLFLMKKLALFADFRQSQLLGKTRGKKHCK